MTRINLLPWREWARERRRRAFLFRIGAAACGALTLAFLAGEFLDRELARQEERHAFLRERLALLDSRIAQLRTLRGEEAHLAARLSVVRALHGDRDTVARMLHEAARAASAGTHYTSLALVADTLSATGAAESAGRISGLMRNLAASDVFGPPTLQNIEEDPGNQVYGGRAVRFELSIPSLDTNAVAEVRP